MADKNPAGSELQKDMQGLAQLAIKGEFGLVRKLATKQLVQAQDDTGKTVLMLVADSDWTPQPTAKCIEYFLHLGSKPSAVDIAGNTAAHLAARRNHLRLLALLPFNAKFVANNERVTPLMEAVQNQSWQCATHLLYLFRQARYFKRKAELLGMKNSRGQTVLQLAEESGQSDLVSVIQRELRLVVNGKLVYNISGLTASEKAAREELGRLAEAGDAAGLRRAATRVTCDLPDDKGETALMLAAWGSADTGAVQQLLALGADATCAQVGGGGCLHVAAEGGKAAAVAALAAAGAPVNAWDGTEFPGGWTPLMRAAFWEPPATAAATGQALLDAGADWSLKGSDGLTALDLAKSQKCSKIAGIILRLNGKAFFDQPLQLSVADRHEIKQRAEQRWRAEEEERRKSIPFSKKWDTVRLLGRGAFAEVHEVLTDMGIKCAAKTIKPPVQLGDQQGSIEIEKLVDAERNFCKLTHRNIVNFLWISHHDASVVLFMELLDGCTLDNVIGGNALDEDKIVRYSSQICNALSYMHSLDPPVIHRDIKGSNIIVLADGVRVKLIDFGLSTKLVSATRLTGSSTKVMGNWHFMAPELFGGNPADVNPAVQEKILYSKESDIWAFGCTVYQMATGFVPYANYQIWAIPELVKSKGAPDLPDGCSKNLKDFYGSCVAIDRKKRKSAADLQSHQFLDSK